MSRPTDADREVARRLWDRLDMGPMVVEDLGAIARVIAEAREEGYRRGREDDRMATLSATRKALDDLRDAVTALEGL